MTIHSQTRSFKSRHSAWARCAASAGVLALTATLHAQTYYDFDSGTDTGWLRSTNPSAITFPTDALGGQAYRLQGTPVIGPTTTNSQVLAYLTNRMYTNFYAAVDVLAWNTNLDCKQFAGLIARANSNLNVGPEAFNPDAPNGIVFAVGFNYAQAYTGPGNAGPLGGSEQMSLYTLLGGGGPLMLGGPAAIAGPNATRVRFRWVPGHAYRLVLTATNNPSSGRTVYTGSIYDLKDLTRPLLSMAGDASLMSSDYLLPSSGYLGVFAFNAGESYDQASDVTFDNFYVGDTAPATSVVAPAIPHGKIGAPQVVNRVPVSFKNFHPAASGITFNASTLTTTNAVSTNAIKLFLNGVDVSAGLAITGPTTNATVSYSGLTTNVVYDGRIVLQDALGRQTTDEWTFDTFSDSYLASSAAKVIEAEDYDFNTDGVNGGLFINDPPASGYANYDPVTDSGTIINSVVGYVDQVGTLGGVDFFDRDGGLNSGYYQYRHNDSVGTQRGIYAAVAYSDNSFDTIFYSQSYDTQRSKYSSLNPTLQEYTVGRTEGGEWLNYTRVFDGGKIYNAYLRAAGGLAQPVRLDQIAAGPATNLLGRFNVPSTFYNHNFRYIPLVTANGDLALVNLSGTTTVRLTMDSPQNEATRYGVALNYMVLVPATPQLYSSATVNGTYTPELNVLVNTGNKKITVPQSGARRFYRIGWTTQVQITKVTVTGGNVVLTYQ